jgi:o-succinylbenzoate synthase
MRIDSIDLHLVAMPLIEPWRTAYGEDAAIHSVLCRMTSGSVDAWGEAAPFAAPCYSPECAGAAFLVIRDWLAPALVGQELSSGAELQNRLKHFKGNPFAKAALDTAWWNLQSKLTGTPLHTLLGATRDRISVGADIGVLDSLDELIVCCDHAVKGGFPRIKLKFRPGWDLPMLKAVRRDFPTQTIHIDCNSGYRLEDIALFQQIDEFELAMIEQPLAHDDLVDHAELQRRLRTPVCLDESISHPNHARQAVALGSCQYVNIKPGRVGGLTNAVAIHDICAAGNIPCWVGGMLESATGVGFCIALAMLENFTYPADIFPSDRFYVQDLGETAIVLDRDSAGVPGVTALPMISEPHAARLAQLTLQQAMVD